MKKDDFKEGVRRYKLKEGKGEAAFLRYIKETKELKFVFTFLDKVTCSETKMERPYVHRWTPEYRKRVLARFYKLQSWWLRAGKPPITMLTLTTYHRGTDVTMEAIGHYVDREESLQMLLDSWRKLKFMLKKRILKRNFDYVYVLENHKDGYPHIHVCIFGTLDKKQKAWVIRLWSEKYCAGSREHGATFSKERKKERVDTSGDGLPIRSRDDVNWIGFYLLKYMGKTFSETEEMTKGDLQFSTLLWKTGARQYNTSRHLAQIMKLDSPTDERLECVKVEIIGPSIERTVHEVPEDEKREAYKSAAVKLKADLDMLDGCFG